MEQEGIWAEETFENDQRPYSKVSMHLPAASLATLLAPAQKNTGSAKHVAVHISPSP